MTRELLQQALDELEMECPRSGVIPAIREYLAQPAPEPVAYQFQTREDGKWHNFIDDKHHANTVEDGRWPIRALYAAAPAPAAEPCCTEYATCDQPCTPRGEWLAINRYPMRASAAPAPDLRHKPTVQHLMDLARKFRATPGDLYDGAYKALQAACYAALAAPAPVVPEEPNNLDVRLFNAGYMLGHHDTVEAQFTDIHPRDMDTHHAEVVAEFMGVDAPPVPVVAEPLNIDAAAMILAECMSYPWDHMPDQGRDTMRKHAKLIINAAHGIGIKGDSNAK